MSHQICGTKNVAIMTIFAQTKMPRELSSILVFHVQELELVEAYQTQPRV